MERAKERARELGRSLLGMVAGGSGSDDREHVSSKRRSWSDVVSSSPPPTSFQSVKTHSDTRGTVGMPKPNSVANKNQGAGSSPGRESSSPKIFSAEEVARLVELARNQLRKEKELNSGWKEVVTKDLRNKERTYARELVDGFQGSPEGQFRCWQCDQPGHKSSECPKGERCFVCNVQGHKRADCPARRKATRAEKGKAVDLGGDYQARHRPVVGITIGEKPKTELPRQHHQHQREAQIKRSEEPKTSSKEWKPIPEPRTSLTIRLGRQQ